MHHLLTLADVSATDIKQICAQAHLMKLARMGASPHPQPLAGQTIALLFEKPSLRTRVSFEVAARELGADCLYLSPQEIGLNQRESVPDVARVLSGYVHCIVIRTFAHDVLESFAQYAKIPVINGLTDSHHPCQGITDIYTILEEFGERSDITIAFVGDGNNCAHSLMQAAVKLGMHIRIATPAGFEPDAHLVAQAQRDGALSGGSVTVLRNPRAAVAGADVIYTDAWTSMGQESEAQQRLAHFTPYRVDDDLLSLAGSDAIVMHPLPAHRGEEITDAVMDGRRSRVFVQAENRLHVQKALLRQLLVANRQVSLSA